MQDGAKKRDNNGKSNELNRSNCLKTVGMVHNGNGIRYLRPTPGRTTTMAAITIKSLASRMDAFESRLAALETKAVAAPAVKAAAGAKITPVTTVTFDTTAKAIAGAYKKGDRVSVPASAVRIVGAGVMAAKEYVGIVTGTGTNEARNRKGCTNETGYTDAITISGKGKDACMVYVWAGNPAVKVIGRAVVTAAS